MKTKISRLMVIVSGFALLAVAFSAYLFHSKGKRAVENYRNQLVANGEKLTVQELHPRTVPLQENSAAIFRKANGLLNQHQFFDTNSAPTAMRSVTPGKAVVAWAQPDVRGDKTNTWEEVQAAAADERELIELLETIIDRPTLDFHLDYGVGFTLLLPHLAPLKHFAQRLSSTSICDLQRGDTESAGKKIPAILAIVKGMEDERLIVSQLVRIAIANIGVAATWEFLQSPKVTDEQLAILQREWTDAEFLRGAENALLMERAMCEAAGARMRQSSAEFRQNVTMYSRGTTSAALSGWAEQAANSAVLKTKESMWRFAWSDPDELKMLRGQQAILNAIRQARTNQTFATALRQQETGLAALGVQPQRDSDKGYFGIDENVSSMMSQSLVSIQRVPQRIFRTEVARQIVIVAIALKRYQLQRGAYPRELAALKPKLLAEMPHDPMDGKPLRYRLNLGGTYVLYSVGEDGKDDGGDVSPAAPSKTATWLQGRDWVWPLPASDEEVKMFYEREAATRAGGRALVEFEKRYGLNATNGPSPVTSH
jgi:hypothetical protein